MNNGLHLVGLCKGVVKYQILFCFCVHTKPFHRAIKLRSTLYFRHNKSKVMSSWNFQCAIINYPTDRNTSPIHNIVDNGWCGSTNATPCELSGRIGYRDRAYARHDANQTSPNSMFERACVGAKIDLLLPLSDICERLGKAGINFEGWSLAEFNPFHVDLIS